MAKKVLIGNTAFNIEDGVILSVSRESTVYTKKDDAFQGALNYVFIMASSNHKESLLDLIRQLNPANDIYTYNAISILTACRLSAPLSDAVNAALSANPKELRLA